MDILIQFSVVIWGFFLIGFLAIGGFFMFRKFLKSIPKADGKSDLDWQHEYIEQTKHMWQETELLFLEELVNPVPELFRDVARQTIKGKIGEVALAKNATQITQDILIEGYIVGTPKRDHKFLRKKLREHEIDITKFEVFFSQSKNDYNVDWKDRYAKKS